MKNLSTRLMYALLLFMLLGISCTEEENAPVREEEYTGIVAVPEEGLIERIIELESRIATKADSVLLSDNPTAGFSKVVEMFKNEEYVEHISFDGYALSVKYKEGGYEFWLLTEHIKTNSIKSVAQIPQINLSDTKKLKSASGYPRMLVINQCIYDEDFVNVNDYIADSIVSWMEKRDINVDFVTGEDFDRDFCKKEFSKYDGIFVFTHGLYNQWEKENTWYITGERVEGSFRDLINSAMMNDGDWSNGKIATITISETDKAGNSIDKNYYAVSQKFFDKHYSPSDFNNTFFYSGACQTMMDENYSFAKVFERKGIKKFIGYTHNVNTGVSVGNGALLARGLAYNALNYNDIEPDLTKTHYYYGCQNLFGYTDEYQGEECLDYTTNLVSYPDDTDFRYDLTEIVQNRIDNVVTPEQVEVLEDMGMTLHTGTNPPNIEGSYLLSPCLLKGTNISGDSIGHRFMDVVIRFYNQEGIGINLERYTGDTRSYASEAIFIAGNDNNFTIYSKQKNELVNDPSTYIYTANIYSGTIENGEIKNLQLGFLCVDDTHNDGTYIPEGSGRLVIDGDYVSETTAWNPPTDGVVAIKKGQKGLKSILKK